MMNNKQYKLICLDLDGTLLNSRQEIPNETLKILRSAEEKGITIAIVTGRPVFDAIRYGMKVSNECYYIGSNGTIGGHIARNTVIFREPMSSKHLNELMEISQVIGIKPTFHLEDNIIIHSFRDFLLRLYFYYKAKAPTMKHIRFVPMKKRINNIIKNSGESVYKSMFIILGNDKRQKADELFGHSQWFEKAVTSTYCYEITEKGQNKAIGVKKLINYLGIKPSEVIAFGDSENDLEMLKMVGCSVAMGNSPEHIKKVARYVTDTNDQEGVAVMLRRVL